MASYELRMSNVKIKKAIQNLRMTSYELRRAYRQSGMLNFAEGLNIRHLSFEVQ